MPKIDKNLSSELKKKKVVKTKKTSSSLKNVKTQKTKLKPIKTFFPRWKSSETSKKTISALTKPRSLRAKENTLDYYNCLISQVDNPLNEKVKITSMCHHCKHNKGKVKVVKTEEKQLLVKKVAQDYLTFGKSLGAMLHADIACSCKK